MNIDYDFLIRFTIGVILSLSVCVIYNILENKYWVKKDSRVYLNKEE